MKEIILLVGHGSRDPGGNGNREVEEFAARWRQRQPDWDIRVCFIEFADRLVAEGLEEAAREAERVIVVPLILNAAGHVKMELPEHLEAARARFPATEFIYVPHLGSEEAILRVLKRRLHQAMSALDRPDPRTTGVILLGRGSSDPMANGEVAKMARWLFETRRHDLVDIAFTGVAFPRLEGVVQRQARLGMTQVVVLPYYLFTGTLIERIRRQVDHLRGQYPHLRLVCADYFGFEPEIFDLVEQRVRDGRAGVGTLPCDGCKYREMAHDAGHTHHHDHGPQHGHGHHHPAGVELPLPGPPLPGGRESDGHRHPHLMHQAERHANSPEAARQPTENERHYHNLHAHDGGPR